jgi:DNA invertase Pin-like site-specific DNA recombinase
MTRVAIYARVSTTNGQTPEMQLRDLRELAGLRQWEIAREYVDNGVSGTKESRPQLSLLMTDARRRKFDTVLVWKLDRFARNLKHLVNALAELEAVGCTFVSFRDNLDLTTPSGRLLFQIVGAMAEFERSLIQERVKAGIRNARAKGLKLGRPERGFDFVHIAELRARNPSPSWRELAREFDTDAGTLHRAYSRWTKRCKNLADLEAVSA